MPDTEAPSLADIEAAAERKRIQSEKMKAAWAKRKAEKSAAEAAPASESVVDALASEAPKAAPAPAESAPGFHSWTAFCNEVSVRLLMTPQGYHLLSSFGDRDDEIRNNISGFFGTMHKAYKAMRMAHAKGYAEFGS